MDTPLFLATIDGLERTAATFVWRDRELTREEFEQGGGATRRAVVQVPREDWEQAGRPVVITVHLAEPDALAKTWDDGAPYWSAR